MGPSGTNPVAVEGEAPVEACGAADSEGTTGSGEEGAVALDGAAGEQPATRRIAKPIANDRAASDLGILVTGSLLR
jgi:hypothetical protein